MLLKFPYASYFEFDTDEGINLMKALLVEGGHPLYRQIWSDQPPLFTYLLAGWFLLFGQDVNTARLLVLLFSSVLMSAAMLFLRKTWGNWHALAGGLLIALLPSYLPLSLATMIGLPSIAFAMLSLERLADWQIRRQRSALILSALFLALSVLTKLFTAFLAPIYVAGLFFEEYRRGKQTQPWQRIAYPSLLWMGSFAVLSGLAFLVLVGPAYFGQLLTPHLAAGQSSYLQAYSQIEPLGQQLEPSLPILALAVVGALWAAYNRRWVSLYPLAWAFVAALLLSQYSLVWYHHLLLITVPAALTAAPALGEMLVSISRFRTGRSLNLPLSLLWLVTVAGTLWVFAQRIPQARQQFLPPEPEHPIFGEATRDEKLVARIADYAPFTQWVITDLPMYAFRAGLPVPPELAVFSTKRLESGALTEAQILAFIQVYQPEQVLLGRFRLPVVEESLQDDYELIYIKSRKRLYLRSELSE